MRRCLGCFEKIEDDVKTCPYCGYVDGTPPEEAVHMEPGTFLAKRYTIGKVLGYGGFGVTYIGWDAMLEHKVAIKEYLPSEFSTRVPGVSKISIFNGVKNEQFLAGLNKFVDEAKRLSLFQKEEGIVKIYDCIAENDTAYIIMEYLEGETLSDRLKREKTIPEKEAVEIMMPVMKSLDVVHNEGIIHRDISPDNIFITKDGKVKLIDFGASRFATTAYSRSLTVIIKPGYSAEEQYRSKSDQGPHTDVYSVAATLYKMITGQTPPDALERRAKLENSKRDILTEPHKINKKISLVTENAILNALNIRIEDRTPTIRKLISDLTAEEPVKRESGKIKKIDLYRMPLWLKVMLASLMMIFLVVAVLLFTSTIDVDNLFKKGVKIPDGYTVVPNIEGLGIDEATKQLTLSKLNYTTGGNITSDYVAANLIVLQNPSSGKMIPINSLVEITVCRGSGVVEEAKDGLSKVPVFIWSEEDLAVNDFETAGLTTTIEYIYDDNVAEGQVIRATDKDNNELGAGDQISEGSTVILYVSKGAEGFSMPNVMGMKEKNAKSTLEQKGLVVKVVYVQSSSNAGTVIEQSIAADSKVTLGTVVEITIATAKPVTPVPAPDTQDTTTTEDTKTSETSTTNESTNVSAPSPTPTSRPIPQSSSNPRFKVSPTPTPTPTQSAIPTPNYQHYCDLTIDYGFDGRVEQFKVYEGAPLAWYAFDPLWYEDVSGKKFDGWYCEGRRLNPQSDYVTSDMYVVAKWIDAAPTKKPTNTPSPTPTSKPAEPTPYETSPSDIPPETTGEMPPETTSETTPGSGGAGSV